MHRPDGSVNVAGRSGFSGNFLTGMAITPADLTGGKSHLSDGWKSLTCLLVLTVLLLNINFTLRAQVVQETITDLLDLH